MNLWVTDPKTKEQSVSLSMLMVSFVALLVACALNMAEIIKDTSSLTELFFANVALYFGRRFNVKGNEYSSEKTEGSQE